MATENKAEVKQALNQALLGDDTDQVQAPAPQIHQMNNIHREPTSAEVMCIICELGANYRLDDQNCFAASLIGCFMGTGVACCVSGAQGSSMVVPVLVGSLGGTALGCFGSFFYRIGTDAQQQSQTRINDSVSEFAQRAPTDIVKIVSGYAAS